MFLQLLLFASLVFGFFARADGNDLPACPSIKTPEDVVNCALSRHPDIARSQSAANQAESLTEIARQRPNPELNSRALFGSSRGSVSSTELNVSHVFELGGKREARVNRAEAEKSTFSAATLKTREDIFVSTYMALHRLRQVYAEIQSVEEAVTTFGHILKFYRARPALSPEQRVSVGVFQIAEADTEFKKTALQSEAMSLVQNLGLATGEPFNPSPNLLPPRRSSWPKPNQASARDGELKSAAMQMAAAELKLANSELSLARSNAWPDLRLGPSVDLLRDGSTSDTQYGINLSLPLPLYQTNKAGRSFANQGVQRAEQNLRLTRKSLAVEREILLQKYEKAVGALSKSANLADSEGKHRNMEDLFQRGLVPSALVIEYHRQIIDLQRSQHEQELTALESLARIYAIDGRLFQEKL